MARLVCVDKQVPRRSMQAEFTMPPPLMSSCLTPAYVASVVNFAPSFSTVRASPLRFRTALERGSCAESASLFMTSYPPPQHGYNF